MRYARKDEVGKKERKVGEGVVSYTRNINKERPDSGENRGGMQWRTTFHPDIACILCINYVKLFNPASNQKSVSERPMRVCLDSRARAEVKVSINDN